MRKNQGKARQGHDDDDDDDDVCRENTHSVLGCGKTATAGVGGTGKLPYFLPGTSGQRQT